MRTWLPSILLAATLASCKTGTFNCTVGGDGGYVKQPYQSLSEYCLVSIESGQIVLNPSVTPYDLNTPLFSNYATKVRGVWLPSQTQATYDPTNAFSFPEGTILTKSFGFADDFRKANPIMTWIETRLFVNTPTGWEGYTYVWNAEQTEATLDLAGEVRPTTWIDDGGTTVTANYLVPSFNQCKECHNDGEVVPIGPTARQLNRIHAYDGGSENEIAHWSRIGILAAAPDPSEAPLLPVWDDPDAGTVEQRARAYLDGNCAYCHNPSGTAGTTGLTLWYTETDPMAYGVCKGPVAAGPATGGFDFDINPAQPDASIMVYRMSSTTPQVMMPQIDRSVVDTGAVALISDWIAGIDGGCE